MSLIKPNWNVPSRIKAWMTTRVGGFSLAPFDSFNLGDHVGDSAERVQKNREKLVEVAQLPQFPVFLTQTHSTKVLRLPLTETSDLNADAVYTNQPNQVCLVMTADCLPVLFCSKDGAEIAAAHAGWRGLCDGILEATLAEFECEASEIVVWLGAGIGSTAFQVGKEVIDQFVAVDPKAREAFIADSTQEGKFFGDLYLIARQRLHRMGVKTIFGGEYCTYCDKDRFFSYRREKQTGRMATLIWRES